MDDNNDMENQFNGMTLIEKTNFSVYAIPPSEWSGDVLVASAAGPAESPTSIKVLYIDDVLLNPSLTGFQVTTFGPNEAGRQLLADLGDERSYRNELVNFMSRFASVPERAIVGARHHDSSLKLQPVSLPSAGMRHPIPSTRPQISSAIPTEWVSFPEHPLLIMGRGFAESEMILLLSWNVNISDLHYLTERISPVRAGTQLFSQIEAKEEVSRRKIDSYENPD